MAPTLDILHCDKRKEGLIRKKITKICRRFYFKHRFQTGAYVRVNRSHHVDDQDLDGLLLMGIAYNLFHQWGYSGAYPA